MQEDRAQLAEQIVSGGVKVENVLGGYFHQVGMIHAIDQTIDRVYEVFAGWLPERQKPKETARKTEY